MPQIFPGIYWLLAHMLIGRSIKLYIMYLDVNRCCFHYNFSDTRYNEVVIVITYPQFKAHCLVLESNTHNYSVSARLQTILAKNCHFVGYRQEKESVGNNVSHMYIYDLTD